MTFDPLAIAVDWLDAYRAGDLDAVVKMYADDAVNQCGCDGLTVTGKEGLRPFGSAALYHPASDLDNLRPYADGATISYVTRHRVVSATMEFDAEGRISRLRSAALT
jgi:hypothetical protein